QIADGRVSSEKAEIDRLFLDEELQADMRSSLRSIAKKCHANGIALSLGISPNRHMAEAGTIAQGLGIDYMDLEALFADKGGFDKYISYDGAHFNSEGYQILAQAYADRLCLLLRPKFPDVKCGPAESRQ
ncbi:MAG TPA: hypothetical protein PLL10_02565, partial [Elusimicrobiales bacterium]|nr:hypothetical protein [Elusimicrobiales bacterium]